MATIQIGALIKCNADNALMLFRDASFVGDLTGVINANMATDSTIRQANVPIALMANTIVIKPFNVKTAPTKLVTVFLAVELTL